MYIHKEDQTSRTRHLSDRKWKSGKAQPPYRAFRARLPHLSPEAILTILIVVVVIKGIIRVNFKHISGFIFGIRTIPSNNQLPRNSIATPVLGRVVPQQTDNAFSSAFLGLLILVLHVLEFLSEASYRTCPSAPTAGDCPTTFPGPSTHGFSLPASELRWPRVVAWSSEINI